MAKKYLKLAAVLKRLLYERDIKPVDLARAVNLPAPTIHRLVTGKSQRPYESSLKPIAEYFSIEVAQLVGEKSLPSADLADDRSSAYAQTLSHHTIISVPLVPWDRLANWSAEHVLEQIPFVGSLSEQGFATLMPDTSMEPIIQRNAIIILDPVVLPKDRHYVLVKLHDTQAYILRQLLIDGDKQYLKPLNPDLSAFKMRLLSKQDEIIACLVETRHYFSDDQSGSV